MFNINEPFRRLLLRDALPAEIGEVSSHDSLFDIIVSISRRIERQFLTHLNGSHRKGSMSKNELSTRGMWRAGFLLKLAESIAECLRKRELACFLIREDERILQCTCYVDAVDYVVIANKAS